MPIMIENINAQTITPALGKNPRQLYEHQEEAIRKLDAMDKRGSFRTLLVLPTGGGKTLTAAYWLLRNAVDQNKKILWLAHRHLLLEQAAEAFARNAYTDTMVNRTVFNYRIISGMHDKPIHIQKTDRILIASKDSMIRMREPSLALNVIPVQALSSLGKKVIRGNTTHRIIDNFCFIRALFLF